jgi:hypothetical protein
MLIKLRMLSHDPSLRVRTVPVHNLIARNTMAIHDRKRVRPG